MNTAINTLKENGHRVTAARIALLETLERSDTPLPIPELASRTVSNDVSVYRNIQLFLTLGLVEIIHTNHPLPHYARSHHHHHHIVCDTCGYIAHIACNDIPSPEHASFGKINRHEVTFFGLCTTCAHSSS